MLSLSRRRMLQLTFTSEVLGALRNRSKSCKMPPVECLGLSRRTLCRLCSSISLISYLYVAGYSRDTYAVTSEVDDDYLSFVVAEVIENGFPCSCGDMGHILYEDDLITVLEIVCESGEAYEILDIYNFDNIIVAPIENFDREKIDNYFDRIL